MSVTVTSSPLIEKAIALGANSVGYARNKLRVPNLARAGADSLASVTLNTAGTGYTGIPAIGFTGGGGSGATAVAIMKALTVTPVAVGSGYITGATITFTGGTFSAAAVATAATFTMVGISLNAAGTGYNPGDIITLAGGTHSVAAQILVNTTVAGAPDAAIATFSLLANSSYTVTATSFTQASTTGTGTGATFNTALFGVVTATITTPGSYSALPTNPVAQGSTSGSGTGFTGNLTYGVLSITLTNGGIDYISVPTVTITGGGGSGATATAVLATSNDSVTIPVQFTNPIFTTDYAISAMPDSACVISATNKTIQGFDLVITPLDGQTLSTGELDLMIEFTR